MGYGPFMIGGKTVEIPKKYVKYKVAPGERRPLSPEKRDETFAYRGDRFGRAEPAGIRHGGVRGVMATGLCLLWKSQ